MEDEDNNNYISWMTTTTTTMTMMTNNNTTSSRYLNVGQSTMESTMESLESLENTLAEQQAAGMSPVMDVTVSSALYALTLNIILFVCLMGAYELFSRLVPSVYASRTILTGMEQDGSVVKGSTGTGRNNSTSPGNKKTIKHRVGTILPPLRSILPLGWVTTVAKTSWPRVLETGGLDAYMYLRFIAMCLRIVAVSGFWGMIVLWPVYATDSMEANGFYLLSMANIAMGSWRIWFPAVFMWLLTFYTMYAMNEEYVHYVDKRMDFLSGRGDSHSDVHPQHQYSIMVEGIPNNLRSDKHLYEYFDKLFPGKVHSTSMVLNIPDLEALSDTRQRIKRRLEKSMAYMSATGRRPVHVVGKSRAMVCGIESITSYGGHPSWTGEGNDAITRPPQKGERVDSINYYWRELHKIDEDIMAMQREKLDLGQSLNDSLRASERISSAIDGAMDTAAATFEGRQTDGMYLQFNSRPTVCSCVVRLGLDFVFAGLSFLWRHVDVVVDRVVGTTMSSTGFVTFYDLASVTCASSAPLSHSTYTLTVAIAPEPRDIYWENAHIDILWTSARAWTANVMLGLGAILWSIPLTMIQALASLESLSKIPGLSFLQELNESSYAGFINGYLPVLALLGLICLLPIIFEWVAVHYEDRKTKSSVESSILSRFFYYQLANIYVTVTAGSIWDSLSQMMENPSSALEIFGHSFPTVVGYFVTFLMTKALVGLPMILLRLYPLVRTLFLKFCFRESKLTQRELDEIHRKEMLMYGWEYPTQLLVVIICFTYACISPIILPVGALYFAMALLVYKKQVLYTYTPLYESGGAMFPKVCHRTLIGLICGQFTLIGYTVIKGGYYQSLIMFPLPIFTFRCMSIFKRSYADHAKSLSLERALELDAQGVGAEGFSDDAYRQPVLTELPEDPLPYRRDVVMDDAASRGSGNSRDVEKDETFEDVGIAMGPLGFRKGSSKRVV